MTGAELMAVMALAERVIEFAGRMAAKTQLTDAEKAELDERYERSLRAYRELVARARADASDGAA